MDAVERRAAAARLLKLRARFAPWFGRRELQEHSLEYLRGLLLADGRKSAEPMAFCFGGPSEDQPQIAQSVALAWQRFVTVSPWEARQSSKKSRRCFTRSLCPRRPSGRSARWACSTARASSNAGPRAWAWRVIQLRDGAKGPLAFAFARLRVWSVRHRHAGPPLWLLIRRSLEPKPELKYYVSNAEADVPLKTMALVMGVRWRVEELEDGKGQLGMADYEARSWTSWHHHMSLVALAHLY
ncbi:MAG: hypothetical protein NUV77_26225, partial [Thermoguttaceae bacterium]|nr:hypothetical protein [Thermoguttaceae bacterium]